ncbi:MAG: hypothetical protein AAGC68_14485, partial [Verrucomicrobiota bacterium]
MDETADNVPGQKCSSCDELLEPSAEGSVCGKCLLNLAMGDSTSLDLSDNEESISARSKGSSGSSSGGWEPPEVVELQALLPQYEIESILGRGGMGAVYRGRQAALDRP